MQTLNWIPEYIDPSIEAKTELPFICTFRARSPNLVRYYIMHGNYILYESEEPQDKEQPFCSFRNPLGNTSLKKFSNFYKFVQHSMFWTHIYKSHISLVYRNT